MCDASTRVGAGAAGGTGGLEGVLETAAVALPPPGGGPDRLWIVAVPKPQSSVPEAPGARGREGRRTDLDPTVLRNLFAGVVRRGLNPLFRVHRVLVAPEGLPRNASNKTMRRVLRERCAEVQEREATERASNTPRAKL